MNRNRFYGLLCFVLMATPVMAASDALPKVNGKALDASSYENLVKLATQAGAKDDAKLRNLIKDQLVLQELLLQKAIDKKLDKDELLKTRIDQARKTLLIEALLDDHINKHPISQDELRKAYDEESAALKDQHQYHLSVIVLADKAVADDVQKKVNQGDSFANLAKSYSLDSSKNSGGDLGWVMPGQVIGPVANVMTNLNRGSTSIEPIPTQVGWHIIKVEDKRKFEMPSFETHKLTLENFLKQKRKNEYVKSLRDSAEIK